MQKLLTKTKFAAYAGVNPSTVTRHCAGVLKPAIVGKYIDAAHPEAVAYLKKRKSDPTQGSAPGLDPDYERAISACLEENNFTATFVQRRLRIGYERARAIVDTMRNLGLIEGEAGEAKATSKMPATASLPMPEVKPPRPYVPAEDENQIYEIPGDIQAFADMSLRQLVDKFGTDVRFVEWLKATKEIEAINEKRLKNAKTEGTLVARDAVRRGIIEPLDSVHTKLLTDGAKTITRRAIAMHEAGRDADEIEKFVKDQVTSFVRPVKTKVARMFSSLAAETDQEV